MLAETSKEDSTGDSKEDSTEASKDLGLQALEEDLYKADMELLDKYQSFSSELLRLSLSGIGAIGILLGLFLKDLGQSIEVFARISIIASAVCFGACVISSLLHRYYSTEGMFYHIRSLRVNLQGIPDEKDSSKKRNANYKFSSKALWAAALFLILAAFCLCISFGVILVNYIY